MRIAHVQSARVVVVAVEWSVHTSYFLIIREKRVRWEERDMGIRQ